MDDLKCTCGSFSCLEVHTEELRGQATPEPRLSMDNMLRSELRRSSSMKQLSVTSKQERHSRTASELLGDR